MSDALLYGGNGHAFSFNLHEDVRLRGPTAWNAEMVSLLAPKFGYRVTAACRLRGNSDADLATGQEAARALIRDAIDRGKPQIGCGTLARIGVALS